MSFPFHSSISDNLIIIADSFNLALSTLTNLCPTQYSDMAGESNSVINLMFLQYGSSELDQYSILPDSWLSSDHASLSIDISIFEEIIQTSKLSLALKSNQESTFIEDIILNFKNIDTSNIEDIENWNNYQPSLNKKCQEIKNLQAFQIIVDRRIELFSQ